MTYRDYKDMREESCMTEDEKLEKRNLEILSLYITPGNIIISQNVVPETVNNKLKKVKSDY